jgi:hypothetical protein
MRNKLCISKYITKGGWDIIKVFMLKDERFAVPAEEIYGDSCGRKA